MTTTFRAAILAVAAAFMLAGVALAATPSENVRQLNAHVEAAVQRLDAGDVAGARAEFNAFNSGWFGIEDGVRGQSRPLYRQIEDRMVDVQTAFAVQPVDSQKLRSALQSLDSTDQQFVNQYGGGKPAGQNESSAPAPAEVQQTATAAPAAGSAADFSALAAHLNAAQQRMSAGDASGAAVEVKAFIQGWPAVEGTVAAKAPDAYSLIENKMTEASGLLASSPPDVQRASADVSAVQAALAPFGSAPVRYGIFDAAIILLREGFEALLVFAALLTFLRRTGNGDKERWVWAGGGAGLALSFAIAVVVNVAFSHAGGSGRELLEGITGLVAAVMLVWMMLWLHSKSRVGAWNRYIAQQSSKALATNSLLSLALIALLAVLREGAETVLFYVGIATGISLSDLLIGLAAGAGALAVVAVLILGLGVRIPVRPFFLATSALVLFLAFKFTGMGIHSLQVAGYLQSHPAPFIPAIGFLGVFPSWDTTALQLALLASVAAALYFTSPRRLGSPEIAGGHVASPSTASQ